MPGPPLLLQPLLEGIRSAVMLSRSEIGRLGWNDLDATNAELFGRHGLNVAILSVADDSLDPGEWSVPCGKQAMSRRKLKLGNEEMSNGTVFIINVASLRETMTNPAPIIFPIPVVDPSSSKLDTSYRTTLLLDNIAVARDWLDTMHRPGDIVRFAPRLDPTAFTGFLLGFPFQYSALPGEKFKRGTDLTLVTLYYPADRLDDAMMTSFSVPSSVLLDSPAYFEGYLARLKKQDVGVKRRVVPHDEADMMTI